MTAKRFASWAIQLLRQAGWPPIALFAAHVVASRGFDAYVRFPALDIPMHILGGIAIAFFFHRASITASRQGIIGPFHRVTHTVLVFSLTCAAAVLWEFSEFLSDHMFGTHAQLGLEDTLRDMFFGISGGVAMITVMHFCFRLRETES